jgi:hypothetical protein
MQDFGGAPVRSHQQRFGDEKVDGGVHSAEAVTPSAGGSGGPEAAVSPA